MHTFSIVTITNKEDFRVGQKITSPFKHYGNTYYFLGTAKVYRIEHRASPPHLADSHYVVFIKHE